MNFYPNYPASKPNPAVNLERREPHDATPPAVERTSRMTPLDSARSLVGHHIARRTVPVAADTLFPALAQASQPASVG